MGLKRGYLQGRGEAHIHPSFVKIEAIGLGSTVVEDISGGVGRLLLLPSAIAILRVEGIRKKQR